MRAPRATSSGDSSDFLGSILHEDLRSLGFTETYYFMAKKTLQRRCRSVEGERKTLEFGVCFEKQIAMTRHDQMVVDEGGSRRSGVEECAIK